MVEPLRRATAQLTARCEPPPPTARDDGAGAAACADVCARTACSACAARAPARLKVFARRIANATSGPVVVEQSGLVEAADQVACARLATPRCAVVPMRPSGACAAAAVRASGQARVV